MVQRLTGKIQTYAWGSPIFIPELLGTKPTGEPQAELWLGAHASASSSVGGFGLDQVIAADPVGVLGAASVEAFGEGLPYLMKVLAAVKPLSLQAHPSRAQAEEGYAREEAAGIAVDAPDRLYKDDWPKPELLCALMDSEALCGFRDPSASYALFERLGVSSVLQVVAPLAEVSVAPEQRLASVFEAVMRLDAGGLVTEVAAAARSVSDPDDEFGLFARTARELAEPYPDDPGVLAALLMNRIALKPHQAVFLPAGNLHAYLYGGGIEIMANSDNVMRGGLTPKHVDVDELLAILDFTPGYPGLVESVEDFPGCWRYRTPAPEFALWRLEPAGAPVTVPGSGLARVLLVTHGSVEVSDGPTLVRGEAVFAAAGEELQLSGHGTAFLAVAAP